MIYRAYLEDDVEASYRAAIDLGSSTSGGTILFYRQLEAEAETRIHATLRKPAPWLQVEARDVVDSAMESAVVCKLEATAKRFGFESRPDTMVTVLISEVDTPWAVGRAGYFVDKVPYDKICMPEAALQSCEQFAAVLSHEYAHLIALHLAKGHAPRWLNEAFATLSEGYPIGDGIEMFKSGYMPWRNEQQLDLAFVAATDNHAGLAARHQAYTQSAVLGKYLQSLKGDTGFVDLLRGFANNSVWKDIAMRFTLQEPVDEALREVYGFGVRELFERALPN